MSKKALIEKFNKGELRPIGVTHITNTSGIAVCHVEHGINDKVFGYITVGETKRFFFVTLKYMAEKIVFNVGKMRFDIGEFMRV
ncbi:hypothetical protein [Paenibacillus agilis]|uniref:Uncharacterized protein n=1 Tax=Paenibacillus agilis TaxID=3020863 RepID=A0A559IEG6_9BACL|nr:hypothetical protein [Paenibacillus agilis]TVX86051.1 hypothetical protein FPZ44_24220 [Paenibacillus agilis]